MNGLRKNRVAYCLSLLRSLTLISIAWKKRCRGWLLAMIFAGRRWAIGATSTAGGCRSTSNLANIQSGKGSKQRYVLSGEPISENRIVSTNATKVTFMARSYFATTCRIDLLLPRANLGKGVPIIGPHRNTVPPLNGSLILFAL